MKKELLVLLFALISINTYAQEKIAKDADFQQEIFAIHPKIGFGINNQIAKFNTFDGMVGCGEYGSQTSYGLSTGLYLERLIFKNTFLSLGFTYNTNNCDKFEILGEYPMRDMQTGLIRRVYTNIGLETKMNIFEIQPDLRFILSPTAIGGGPLRLVAGARFAIPLNATFRQYEEITDPEYAYFHNPDGTDVKSRNLVEGDITTLNSMSAGLCFGFDNLIRLDEGHAITQELMFDYNLSNWTSDADWGFFAIRLSLGYRFGIYKTKEEKAAEIKDFPTAEQVQMASTKQIPELPVPIKQEININYTGNAENIKYSGTELLATVPLVNAVFFDKNSSIIPAQYSKILTSNIDFFRIESVEAHDDLFSRISEIINKNDKASITLVGTTSGDDEDAGIALAKQRAENVKSAFIKCGVPENKIKIKTTKTPSVPSNDDFEAGKEENRRVEVIIKNAPLQEYVDFVNFSELQGALIVEVNTKGLDPSHEIKFTTNLSEKPIFVTLDKLDRNNEIRLPYKYRINENDTILYTKVTAEIVDSDLQASFEQDLNISTVQNKTIDKDLSKFRAILRFDYDSAELSADNQTLLKQLGTLLPKGATISVLGSADDLGSGVRNKQLTKQRADNTQTFINKNFKGKFKIETGQSDEKVSEDTPQGRFINRCIIITVKD